MNGQFLKEEALLTSGNYSTRVRVYQYATQYLASVYADGPGIVPPLGVIIASGHTPEAAVENAKLTAATLLTALNWAYEAGRAS